MMRRLFIVGNGGSGKSWLAEALGQKLQLPVVHLDDLHWLPDFAGERPRDERDQLVAEAAEGGSWIMEGIYGSILTQVLPRVETLIWIDLPDDECISNLRQRGQSAGATTEQFEELLAYTRGYRQRKNHLNSFDAHARFFEMHASEKWKLGSRADMASLLAAI
jgi:adenylate kinase family enzyme